MPIRTSLTVGSAPNCDIVWQGPGVAPQHVAFAFVDGLVMRDLGAAQTVVDGRTLAATETVTLPFHATVVLGGTSFPLNHPALAQLFVDRGPLPAEPDGSVVVGRDPSRAQLVVHHPTVSGAHARLDPSRGTLTDLGSKSGTFDRAGQRLPAQQPTLLDREGGYFFGMAYVATSVLVELARTLPSTSAPPMTNHEVTSLPQHAPAGVPPAPKPAPSRPKTMFGTFALPSGETAPREAIIGRLPSCDIVLPYPQLSARHAAIMAMPDRHLFIRDLGSTNGTYVRGVRVPPQQPVPITPGERIFVGPYPVIVDLVGDTISAYIDQERTEWSGNLVEVEALDLFVQVPDREDRRRSRTLLDHVTFKARPGDLIALMGPSGAGKTTLLTVLNGYLRPTAGEVRVNGENLYAIYDALRGSIGYVPQDDIVHPELTVWEAIKYSAQFRLPPDYSEEEIDRRVEQTVKDLGLEPVKHLEIGRPERKVLSGGQRKRVNIALELVTDPALMFLDEPTSGLAADDTVALIDLLAGLARKRGKTIIVTIHQPAREEYEKFNLALILGQGGVPVYYGPTGRESYDFFGRYTQGRSAPVDNPRDMFDLLRKREDDLLATGRVPDRPAARLAAAHAWRAEYYQPENPTYVKMYTGERAPGTPGKNRPPTRGRAPLLRQFRLLLSRYARVKWRDRSGTAILFAQAPIIGVLLAAVFAHPTKVPNMWCRMFLERVENNAVHAHRAVDAACLTDVHRFPDVADFAGAIFFLAIASIWFGTSNAAREIVTELAIYRRERMVNLSVFNYVMSKFVLLSAFCIVQCTILLAIVYPVVRLGGGSWDSFFPMLGMMVLTAMCAVAIGLLLSTVVVSTDAAMALTPIALIPQVVLGGRLVPMTNKHWLKPVMSLIPARWSFEGVLSAERDAIADAWRIHPCVTSGTGIEDGWFQCALEEMRNAQHGLGGLGFVTYDRPEVAGGVLAGMTFAVLLLVIVLLWRRDSI